MSPIANRFAALIACPNTVAAWKGERPEGDARARAYRFHRNAGKPAGEAFAAANADYRAGRNRAAYTFRNVAGSRSDRGGRWIENPGAAGFRFVGWADNLAPLDHTGWYTDDMEFRTARAAVYQLPSRGGRALYVEAIHTGQESRNGFDDDTGGALVFLDRGDLHAAPGGDPGDTRDGTKRDAARGADEEARIYAEREREYNEASNAGYRAGRLIEEAHGIREAIRPALAELRAMRLAGVVAPTLCATLRRSIAADLRDAREKVADARKLWDEWADLDTWRANLADLDTWRANLATAFRDGAGVAAFGQLLQGKGA